MSNLLRVKIKQFQIGAQMHNRQHSNAIETQTQQEDTGMRPFSQAGL
jgi:hypothetical protein